MADRPQSIENMAVSSDASASQHNLKDNDKDENDLRGTQSNPKMDAPKKKTTFKITSVTKSSQRGGSGDLTQDNDLDSQDDLDETVDSHTEDLSSEIYDTNSKATDLDNQDQLTPEEVIKESEPKEKPARFKVVKVETKEPFKRGRWMCYDYLDAPEKSENKQEEINVNSGSSSAANSVHYVHGVDDPSKNPLLAGASGTLPSLQQQPTPGDLSSGKLQGETLQQVQPASSSQPGLTPVSQTNSSFVNHVGMSSVPNPYGAKAGQTMGQSMMPVVGSVTNMHQGRTLTGGSVSGNVPYPSGQSGSVPYPGGQSHSQSIPNPQGSSSIPANVHSQQPVSVPGSVVTASQPMPPGAMQAGLNSQMGQEYLNSRGQGQGLGGGLPGQQGLPPQQSGLHDLSQQSAYGINNPGLHPSQNHPSSLQSQLPDGFGSDVDLSHLSGPSLGNLGILRGDGEDSSTALGAGLAPLEIAVGGITSTVTDDEITEETGSSTVAIDNKIEQAMDLVKSHLMYAVREEVEVLKEQIKELMERLHKLEQENKVLRSEATPETLSKLPAPLPPIQNPLLQQLMTLHNPSSSSSSS